MGRSFLRPSSLSRVIDPALFFACAFATIMASQVAAMDRKCEYTKDDNKAAVKLELHDVTSVRLPVQMGTGYSWKVASLPDVLEQESVYFKGEGGKPGGSELQVFRFRSVKKGDGTLTLVNVRPWEQPGHPVETFTLNIAVE